MKWVEVPHPPVSDELIAAAGGNKVVAEVLASRGVTNPEQVRAFLNPDFYRPSPPQELPGMDKAIGIIEDAIKHDLKIGVWGDFDVDGQTATTLLVSAFKMLGLEVIYHIPIRAIESHGVNVPNLAKMLDEGVKLVVTCDTGIGAHTAVDYAIKRGVNVIITDHHDLPAELPKADAIINPKILPGYHPLFTLPGAGVAYKLIEGVFQQRNLGQHLEGFLDLVALGIVADIAILRGDTRYLLQRGLEQLSHTKRLGLQILFDYAEISGGTLTEEDISYSIAPRLNSLGRLGDANVIVDFLTSDQESLVRVLANRLEGLNAQRKLLSSQVFQAAVAQLERNPSLLHSSGLVLASQNWPAGVVGIVANRLVEKYHKPTILLTVDDDGLARGSARSVAGCDISKAIAACADLLESFGGHPMAAGLAIQNSNIENFKNRLSEEIDHQMGDISREPEFVYDFSLNLGEVSLSFLDQIEMLSPFGPGNPPLVFVAENIRMVSHSVLGRSEEHLRLIVEDASGEQQKVIWWQGVGWELPQGVFDLAYGARKNVFRGMTQLQLELLDFRIVEAIEPDETGMEIEVVDLRGVENARQHLTNLVSQHPEVLVWAEAPDMEIPLRRPRGALIQAEKLAIWHSPPSVSNLRVAVDRVNPRVVFVYGDQPGLDNFEVFITRLAGLCKFVVSKKDGATNLGELASAMVHTEATVRLGLAWLEDAGKIVILEEDTEKLIIGQSVQPALDRTALEITKETLSPLLREAKSFRKYLAECKSSQLEELIRGR